MALSLLQHIIGTNQRVKYNQNTSLIGKAVKQAAQSQTVASSINMQYPDTGLFGFHVVADYKETGAVSQRIMRTTDT